MSHNMRPTNPVIFLEKSYAEILAICGEIHARGMISGPKVEELSSVLEDYRYWSGKLAEVMVGEIREQRQDAGGLQ